jgi:hypothetical protein
MKVRREWDWQVVEQCNSCIQLSERDNRIVCCDACGVMV